MLVSKLRLMNGYKRFHDLTIDLGQSPKRIIALVGPNGCGKSSVLDGMLFHNRAYGQFGKGLGKDYTYHSMNGEKNFSYQNVEITFTSESYEKARERLAKLGKENTIFSFRSPYRYNSHLKVSDVKSTEQIALNTYGAGTVADLDEKVEENYRRLNAYVNSYINEHDCKPSEARQKLIGELNESIRNCLDLEICHLGNIEAGQGSLYFKKKDHPKEFEFNVLSAGEKEVIDILLDLFLRRNDYNDSVFLLDEPELHINTAIQKNLLIEIDRLIGKDCQIWITTHSIGFLRTLQCEMKDKCQIIQFKSDDQLALKPYILRPMRSSQSNWKEVFSVALDDLAHLVSPNRIIYCEGRADPKQKHLERGMDAQVLNNIFAESYPDNIFISSGGNTELDQRSDIAISIIGKVFSKLEILVLKDRDMASGKETNESDRLIYLKNNPHSHRVLNRWELENYLFDKEVLNKYCNLNGLMFNEALYDNLVQDISNQNLKDETGKIKNICNIKGSINAETFKINLSKCISQDMTVYAELESCIFNRA